MKFPNSPHAEGWLSHIENAEPTVTTGTAPSGVSRAKPKIGIGPKGPGRRLSASELRFDDVSPAAAAVGLSDTTAMPGATIRPTASASGATSTALHRQSSNTTPWLIGAGVAVVLIAGAVTMSRHTASTKAADTTPAVVSQADTPAPKAAPSAEDAQLAAAPSGAGVDTAKVAAAEPAAVTPAATPAPAAEPAAKVAAATPAPMFTKTTPAADAAPKVIAKADAPAPQAKVAAKADPVVRTLTPPADTTAQATPPATTLADATPMAQPATPPVAVTEPQPTAPVTTAAATPAATAPSTPAAPVTTADANTAPPAVVAQAAPAPAADDAGITTKVRSALVADTMLSGVPISVTTSNGVVKLEGQAPDAQAREHATAVVASTTGVKGVDNRLTVPPVAQLQLSPASQGS